MDLSSQIQDTLKKLDLLKKNEGSFGKISYPPLGEERILDSISPINNQQIASIYLTSEEQYNIVIEEALEVFNEWRTKPAPFRGEIIRQIGEELRRLKEPLATLITLETGKIYAESLGEVQEAIDMADFAVGLSRQLYGKVIQSERFQHRMYEQWHPLGVIGVITAFNFPMAVWAWNAMIAAICGDVIVWKPSEQTPLSALAINNIARKVSDKYGFSAVFSLVTGDGPSLGKKMAEDKRLPLISATGSCKMGKSVAQVVASRMGKYILELGGNNGLIVLNDANIELAIRAILFGAVGTAGQRCTTTRRVLIEPKAKKELLPKLLNAYKQIKIGNPLNKETLMGPLINEKAVDIYRSALNIIKQQGGKILYGGKVLDNMPSSYYVLPTIVEATKTMPILKEETFAPILYIIEVSSLDEAIEINNSVPQGLSSAIFTESLKTAEKFLSAQGSDCGIANVNIGTSGAEIGGAFGGEKDTGGGREAGSDAWKQYMRRQTVTINWSNDLPLAQGIKFS